ncbi:2OG-Fe(II) oxygenase [Rhizobacter sp. LjRoot28]|uniref:2OG-Fe(II) oxygenase n=1 Tax=Rhizobacter sp. LjRoot28 TaxID=3342309 RepID=UPI003F4FF66B
MMSTVIPASSASIINPFRHYTEDDAVTIRGRRLVLADLVSPQLFDAGYIAALTQRVADARPFRYLNEEGWFNPVLLELAREEFTDAGTAGWTEWAGRHQHTFRSPQKMPFGPATFLYFSLVNSGWFTDILSTVMGVPDLITDAQLYGGGLHESRNGGRFGIHRDFDRHPRTRLNNELSMMTYLNKDWNPAWGGALELWDEHQKACVLSIEPDFNRTVVLCHGPTSFHGHPHPLRMPEGVTRRSLSSYYFSNPEEAVATVEPPQSTVFLLIERQEMLREAVRNVAPPILLKFLKRAMGR